MRLRMLIASVFGIACLGGCGDFWPGKPVASVDPTAASEAGFRAVYDAHCAACHGQNGMKGAARPLNDPLYLAITPKASFTKAVSHGQGILMPAYLTSEGGPLDEKALATFVDDIYTYWGDKEKASAGNDAPSYASSSGSASSGKSAFATWCGACHGQNGTGLGDAKPVEGALAGHSVVDQFYLRLISDQGIRSAVIFGHPEFGMPSYKGPFPGMNGKAMDEKTIDDIVAWIISQRVTVQTQAQEVNP